MQKVLDYLDQNQKRFLLEFCDYLRYPSVSAQPQHKKDLHACAEWLVAHCRAIGLNARLAATAGNPVVVAKTFHGTKPAKPHFMIYGHYDVQPPEPLELWQSPPFEPRIEGRTIYARGTTDNKGQNFAHLKAVEAYLKTGTPLPCDLTFVIEGEEEVGSESLSGFLNKHRRELDCQAIVISDTGIPSPKHPALTYALR
ncbi:MAG TPA: M20/M25/M40 family metallo-hydrolase, partial [Verrucomicrobiae bacterium]